MKKPRGPRWAPGRIQPLVATTAVVTLALGTITGCALATSRLGACREAGGDGAENGEGENDTDLKVWHLFSPREGRGPTRGGRMTDQEKRGGARSCREEWPKRINSPSGGAGIVPRLSGTGMGAYSHRRLGARSEAGGVVRKIADTGLVASADLISHSHAGVWQQHSQRIAVSDPSGEQQQWQGAAWATTLPASPITRATVRIVERKKRKMLFIVSDLGRVLDSHIHHNRLSVRIVLKRRSFSKNPRLYTGRRSWRRLLPD